MSTGNGELDGGVYVVGSGDLTFTYFCHEGVYKSCYVVPEGAVTLRADSPLLLFRHYYARRAAGFSDPDSTRFQPIGGVATFADDSDGSEAQFA